MPQSIPTLNTKVWVKMATKKVASLAGPSPLPVSSHRTSKGTATSPDWINTQRTKGRAPAAPRQLKASTLSIMKNFEVLAGLDSNGNQEMGCGPPNVKVTTGLASNSTRPHYHPRTLLVLTPRCQARSWACKHL